MGHIKHKNAPPRQARHAFLPSDPRNYYRCAHRRAIRISNPRLRAASWPGKNENMPNENNVAATRAPALEGETRQEVTCEGYVLGGVGMLIQRSHRIANRIVGAFRHLIITNGGNPAAAARGWFPS